MEPYGEVSDYAAASRAAHPRDLPAAYVAMDSVDAFVDENRDYAQWF